MKKNKYSRYFLILAVTTFLAIFVLIAQKSYDNLMKATVEAKKSNLIVPIDPNLDLTILDQIEKRKEFLPTP
ncbi:hypothetical protein COS78_03285 [Candidatus Shapirobacteria bacterium CG06_land_8_20_14_3_00_40_12]|uniref:Uncharacterized protein n=2 Tax=Candidatus Shapironibacteriota TaxID=1752721 RepID=A0A2M7TTC6_9BACT|nr:MAG: hypothetical protein COS78_03285 [Candidatus Shapirobacteria bacterium CG06_land_8_20_14_3_00_40_12]PIZ59266.1 MAG: hypothetical protein COY20_02115 [Candidatus Shapirobacteria bacterium CG_4_10_14_0_2_um_filter_40_12]